MPINEDMYGLVQWSLEIIERKKRHIACGNGQPITMRPRNSQYLFIFHLHYYPCRLEDMLLYRIVIRSLLVRNSKKLRRTCRSAHSHTETMEHSHFPIFIYPSIHFISICIISSWSELTDDRSGDEAKISFF